MSSAAAEEKLPDGTDGNTINQREPEQSLLTHLRSDTLDRSTDDVRDKDNDAFHENQVSLDDVLHSVVQQEFPDVHLPSIAQLIHVGDSSKPRDDGRRYQPGDWVEVHDPDLNWRLVMITKVIKTAPPDFDWNSGDDPPWTYSYHASHRRDIPTEKLRSPEEGLVRVFGKRPWVWQQWACLKVEDQLRFQKSHQHDFSSFDVLKYVTRLWDEFLNHENNEDFRRHFYDDRYIGEVGRSELVNHIMTPFHLLASVVGEESAATWDFAGERHISIFTYLSLLGSGIILPNLVVFLQVAIPSVLAVEAFDGSILGFLKRVARGEGPKNDDNGGERGIGVEIMTFLVLMLYYCKVVPDTLSSFYKVVGPTRSVYSRLMALRKNVRKRRDDTAIQQWGFQLDDYLNSGGYDSILYILNIVIIMTTTDVLDVILNSLAFAFISAIDEEAVTSDWWDPDNRWITAGAFTVILQNTLRVRWLACPELFAHGFQIDSGTLLRACDGNKRLFKEKKVAKHDCHSPQYVSQDELVRLKCRDISRKMENRRAIEAYDDPISVFGAFEGFLRSWMGMEGFPGAFDFFQDYRTWSRWERVLYLCPIPNLDEIFEEQDGKIKVAASLHAIVPTEEQPFANFDPFETVDPFDYQYKETTRTVVRVLTFQTLFKNLCHTWTEGNHIGVLFTFLGGILQWWLYVVQLTFPFVVAGATIVVFCNLMRLLR